MAHMFGRWRRRVHPGRVAMAVGTAALSLSLSLVGLSALIAPAPAAATALSGSSGSAVTWAPVGGTPTPGITALLTVGNVVYAGGADGNVYTWNGSQWSQVGTLPVGGVKSFTVANGVIYGAVGQVSPGVDTISPGVSGLGCGGSSDLTTVDGQVYVANGSGGVDVIQNGACAAVGGNVGGAYPVQLATVGNTVYAGTSNGSLYAWTGSTWSSVGGTGPSEIEDLIAAGGSLYAEDSQQVWVWNGLAWTQLGSLSVNLINTLYSPGKGVIYAASNNNIWLWNGTAWSAVGKLAACPYCGTLASGDLMGGGVAALTSLGGVLYAGTPNGLFAWNGSVWTLVGGLSGGEGGFLGEGYVNAVSATVGGQVYAGTENGVWDWNGSAWSQVGIFPNPAANEVYSLATVSGVVYAGSEDGNVYSLNGSEWTNVGNLASVDGASGGGVFINFLATLNGVLYAGSKGSSNVWSWNGTTWSNLGNLSSTDGGSSIGALAALNGVLYAGSQDGNVWSWSGTAWSNVGNLSSSDGGGSIGGVAVLNGDLYALASGSWTWNGYAFVGTGDGLWQWNGSAWSLLGGFPGGDYSINATALTAGNGMLFAVANYDNYGYGVFIWNGLSLSLVGNFPSGVIVKGVLTAGGNLYAATYYDGGVMSTPAPSASSVTPTISVSATPSTIPADGASTSTITATLMAAGAPISGATVSFATSAGTLGATSAVTDASGVATDTLTAATTPGFATVTATAGTVSGSATVAFGSVNSDLLFTSNSSLAASSAWGQALPAIGAGSTQGESLPWTFAQATFLVTQGSAAGDVFITGSAAANYTITVSYTNPAYGPTVTSGSFSATSTTTIDLNQLVSVFNEGGNQGRTVTIALVAPAGSTTYGVGSISVAATGEDAVYDLTASPPPALSVGSTSGTVGTQVSVPLMVQAAPLPMESLLGNLSFDSSVLQFDGITGAPGVTATANGTNLTLSAPNGLGAGQTAAQLQFTLLAPGTSPVSFTGGQYSTGGAWWASGNLQEAEGQVTSSAPATPLGVSGFTPSYVPASAPGAGTTVSMTVYGWGLDGAGSVTLVSQDGGSDMAGTIASSTAGSLAATFANVALGAYQVEVAAAGGSAVSGPGDLVVAPGVPLFQVTEQSYFSTAPGFTYSHKWRVVNAGAVPGVALILIRFPTGASWTSLSGVSPVYTSGHLALVAVPVAAGGTATFSFSETMSPSFIIYPGEVKAPGTAWPMGAVIHTAFFTVGNLTESQWQSIQSQSGLGMASSALTATIGLDQQYWAEIHTMSQAGQSAYLTALDSAVPGFAPPTSLLFPNGSDPSYLSNLLDNAVNTLADTGPAIWNGLTSGQDEDSLEGLVNGITNNLTFGKLSVFSGPSFGNQTGYDTGNAIGQLLSAGEITLMPGPDTVELGPVLKAIEDGSENPEVLSALKEAVQGYLDQFNANPTLASLLGVGDGLNTADNLASGSSIASIMTQMYQGGNQTVASEDPNAITVSPEGSGSQGYILNGQPLTVGVQFENSPNATAMAHNVEVDVQLGSGLNPSSVQFLAASTATAPLMSVTAGGLVRFFFNNIDLPPDTAPPAGQGGVEFSVAPLATLADNTPLTVSANVYFDYNPPVATGSASRLIDAATPQATVAPLPAQSSSNIAVSWSGTDSGGPGIASYSVLVSEDGGAYQPWLVDTSQTAATYSGQAGHTYAFVALAQDLLGQAQAMPLAAQAQTTVVAGRGSVGGFGAGGASSAFASIGLRGGTLTTADHSLVLTIPAGAFAKSVTITATALTPSTAPPSPAGYKAAAVWSFDTGGVEPTKAVSATFAFNPSLLGGLSPSRLGVYTYDPTTQEWTWVGGTVDTATDTITVTLPHLSTFGLLVNTTVFSDLTGYSWARPSIDLLLGAGIVTGVSATSFDPSGSVTRAQFATMLVRAEGLSPIASGTTPFTDVATTSAYAPYIAAAYQAGLVMGVSATTFQPNAPITRQQMAVILARVLGSSATAGTLSQFKDVQTIASWAKSGVEAAVGTGLMAGFPNGTFQPTATSTRAQAAVVLARYLTKIGKV